MTTLDSKDAAQQSENHWKSPTNWNNLPSEMKLLCITKMDIKTRMGLRCSSKTEKRLVDSTMYKFDRVEIELDDIYGSSFLVRVYVFNGGDELLNWSCWKEAEERDGSEEENNQKIVNILHKVFTWNITKFTMTDFHQRGWDCHVWMEDVISNLPLLCVEKLSFWMDSNELVIPLLTNCSPYWLTDIEIEDINHLDATFFKIPQVFHAKRVRMRYQHEERSIGMAMNWLEVHRNSPEDEKVLEVFCNSNPIPQIMEKLGTYTIRRHRTEQAVRMTTSDPSLHIWCFKSSRDSFLYMFIVPSDSEDPDFVQMDVSRSAPIYRW